MREEKGARRLTFSSEGDEIAFLHYEAVEDNGSHKSFQPKSEGSLNRSKFFDTEDFGSDEDVRIWFSLQKKDK